jgi:hypothetical protein
MGEKKQTITRLFRARAPSQALAARQDLMEQLDLVASVGEVWNELELHAHPDNPRER